MHRLVIALVALSTACSAALPPRPVAADHPANPTGPPGHVQEVPRLLPDASDRPAESVLGPSSAPAHQHDASSPETGAKVEPGPKAEGVVYTCPMHPEVHSTEPGKCPKCGMALVPRESKP